MAVPQKTKDRVTMILGMLSGKEKNSNLKRYMDPNVHSSQDMEAIQMSIVRRMDYEEVVHINNDILLSHKRE